MKPSTIKKARALNLDGPLYVRVTPLDSPDSLNIDAAYNREEIIKTDDRAVIGVYELVRLEEATGVEAVTFKEIK